MTGSDGAWLGVLPGDPRSWLRHSDEPYARWVTRVRLDDRPSDDPTVHADHRATMDDPVVRALIGRLPAWTDPVRSHGAPTYAPNLLNLLADLGVTEEDELPAVQRLLDEMLEHRTPEGRFLAFASFIRQPEPAWSTVACDHYAITEVLVRYGRADDPRVRTALALMADDITDTSMGRGCRCLPHSRTGGRGPGRVADPCPQVTAEALRTFGRLGAANRPAGLDDVARTVLRVWRERSEAKPYMFGHGAHFKAVKWPNIWYSDLTVLEALAPYPEVWTGASNDRDDTAAAAELVACLAAYNADSDGRVVPRSIYRGFDDFSFGQKKKPSPIATAWVCAALRSFDVIGDTAAAVDVTRLGSAKGGTGVPVPPRSRP